MRPKSNFHSKFKLLYLLFRHKIKHLMCKCCCSHSRPRFCTQSSFVNVWYHPKEAINLFLNWKKIGVSHQNRAVKKECYKTEKAAILNSHAYFSFFSSIYDIQIWIQLTSLIVLSHAFIFLLTNWMLFCLWLCAWDTRRWSNNSNFYIFAIQSIPWSSFQTTEVEVLVVGAR